MNSKKLLCFVFLLSFAVLVIQGRAQSYAPDTEYHDPVQRVFVVEAARILAWRANQGGDRITEITFTCRVAPVINQSTAVTSTNLGAAVTSTNRGTVWQIKWLDAEGKTVKSSKVEYPEALLKQGAAFYHQTFQQLWAAGWKPPQAMECAGFEQAYWLGAGLAGASREESLLRAYGLPTTVVGQGNEKWIPEMAGLLIHASLPGVAGHLSLDWLLMARGAAWLALGEQTCANEVASLWSPVLFLAGREQAAAKVWPKRPEAGETKDDASAWNLWLARPTSKDVYLFAVDSDCRPIALAMLAYDVQANGSWNLLAEMLPELAGSERRLISWHNYGPLLARWAGIDGGRILEGAWPAHQRHAWLNLMKLYHPLPQEKLDFSKEWKIASEAPSERRLSDSKFDASRTGFTNFAPLLRLGLSEGIGKLGPTAVATGRDLLNYGWESTGLQMGERYSFVRWRWGVPELAKPILQTVTREVPGLMPFFLNAGAANAYNYQDSLRRLQNVDGFQFRMGWSPNPFRLLTNANESAETFVRSCWLRSSEFEWQARSLWDEGKIRRITDLIDAIKSEAGPLAVNRALSYLTSVGSDAPKPFWRVAKAIPSLAEMLAQPSALWVRAVWSAKFGDLSPLAKAEELEKTYWRNTDSGVENWILHYYSHAGAFQAARRFYLQARTNFLDSVVVSHGVGQSAFVLGYCLQDKELRRLALADSASGSEGDMMMHIWDAALRDDRKELKDVTDELIERYQAKAGAESSGRQLRDFLPLLDALADVKHPRHKEAVDHFGNYGHWIFLRWIWIEKYKLPKEDAIAFLGGREAGPVVHALVCGLDEDVAGAKQIIDDMITKNEITAPLSVLASYVCRKVTRESLATDVPDLKPPGATSTRSAVLARLKAKPH